MIQIFTLIELVNKNLQLDHPNILGIKDALTFDDKFWVAFPSMYKGSLRCLMASCYKNGFPEELIAITLKEALKGLAYLHQEGHGHREFNSGHIYFGLEIPIIKIGFLASIYEHNSEYSQPSESLPETTICDWAAAPEVYNLTGEYTDKSDVWLVGITAMELAFGGIRVQNRQDLEAMIAEVINSGKNGDKENDNQNGTGKKKSMAKFFKKMVKMLMSSKSKAKKDSVSDASLMVTDRKLSQSFKEMLGECLNEDPEKRPTSDELLQHEFFKNCNDMFFFQDAVRLAKR